MHSRSVTDTQLSGVTWGLTQTHVIPRDQSLGVTDGLTITGKTLGCIDSTPDVDIDYTIVYPLEDIVVPNTITQITNQQGYTDLQLTEVYYPNGTYMKDGAVTECQSNDVNMLIPSIYETLTLEEQPVTTVNTDATNSGLIVKDTVNGFVVPIKTEQMLRCNLPLKAIIQKTVHRDMVTAYIPSSTRIEYINHDIIQRTIQKLGQCYNHDVTIPYLPGMISDNSYSNHNYYTIYDWCQPQIHYRPVNMQYSEPVYITTPVTEWFPQRVSDISTIPVPFVFQELWNVLSCMNQVTRRATLCYGGTEGVGNSILIVNHLASMNSVHGRDTTYFHRIINHGRIHYHYRDVTQSYNDMDHMLDAHVKIYATWEATNCNPMSNLIQTSKNLNRNEFTLLMMNPTIQSQSIEFCIKAIGLISQLHHDGVIHGNITLDSFVCLNDMMIISDFRCSVRMDTFDVDSDGNIIQPTLSHNVMMMEQYQDNISSLIPGYMYSNTTISRYYNNQLQAYEDIEQFLYMMARFVNMDSWRGVTSLADNIQLKQDYMMLLDEHLCKCTSLDMCSNLLIHTLAIINNELVANNTLDYPELLQNLLQILYASQ